MKRKIILLISESHNSLGLFSDLENDENVSVIVVKQRSISNPFLKMIKKLHTSSTVNKHIALPFRKLWFQSVDIKLEKDTRYVIAVVDLALRGLDLDYLNMLFSKPNVNNALIMINSFDASSIGMLEIKKELFKLRWNRILTFDPADAEKYSWEYMGCCYYSMHDAALIKKSYQSSETFDAYFTGGLKGEREQLIVNCFEKLYNSGIKTSFNILVTGSRRLKKLYYQDRINYYSGGWIPYEKVLSDVLNSDVIIEILQKGQNGPSLRYYEAVCYNKKLLSNNPNLTKLPYYDPRFMKYFKTSDDINVEWIRTEENIDYGYHGDFSPRCLLEKL